MKYVVFDWKLSIFPLLSCTQRDAIKLTIFTVAGRFRLIQVLEFWIFGTSDPPDCNIFFSSTSCFRYVQVTFNTGFSVKKVLPAVMFFQRLPSEQFKMRRWYLLTCQYSYYMELKHFNITLYSGSLGFL